MERRDCDAVVLFGATGDLCYRKIYPALYQLVRRGLLSVPVIGVARQGWNAAQLAARVRSEEHTSELQSQSNLVCRLLLEKKNIALSLPRALLPARERTDFTL